jgi:tRNA-dihydrouridine synthase B
VVKIGNVELPDFPLILAPMEDVSDPPFRLVCKQHGADLMFTEFISSEGLIRDAIKSRKKLDILEEERPVGIQIFGGDEEALSLSAKICETVNPNIIDINFGCPVKKVVCKGAGAGILKDLPKMVQLTRACVQAVSKPVTVKTRLGWDDNTKNIEEVAERLQDVGIAALSIHGRTRTQMYKGEADWSLIAKVKNNPRIHIPIFGNGDIDSPQKCIEYKNRYGVDGVMIGRAAIGNPFIFEIIKHYRTTGEMPPPITIAQKVAVVKQHLQHSMQWKGEKLGILEMRPHYSNYLKGIPNIKDYKMKIVLSLEAQQIMDYLDEVAELENAFL